MLGETQEEHRPDQGGDAGKDASPQKPSLRGDPQKARTTREKAMEDLRKGILVNKMRDKIIEEANVAVTDDGHRHGLRRTEEQFQAARGLHLQQIFIKTEPAEFAR